MSGLILVEGLPGTGKSTAAAAVASWLRDERNHPAEHWPEGRIDHPVDFEQVSVLTADTLNALCDAHPDAAGHLRDVAVAQGEFLVVQRGAHAELPQALLDDLSRFDAYDGEISAAAHHELLSASWARYGASPAVGATQVWECVLIQNPVCAFVARFDEPSTTLEQHVSGLVESVATHRPALVYLDAGDPADVLASGAAERPAEWLDAVIRYHTEQGYGLRLGLHGFDGYVEFMRHRRVLELALLQKLELPVLVVDTADRQLRAELVRTFVARHLDLSH